MNRRLALSALGLVVVLGGWVMAAELTYTKDSLDAVKTRVTEKKAVLVDVRSADEWNDGHLKLAVSIPVSELASMNEEMLQDKLPKDKIIYTHCAVGLRAMKAGKVLQKYGYDVRPLKAGYDELARAGFEAVR